VQEIIYRLDVLPVRQTVQRHVQDYLLGGGKTERPKAESGVGFLGKGQQPPPHQIEDLREPKGFPLFSALMMASPDIIILLIVDYLYLSRTEA